MFATCTNVALLKDNEDDGNDDFFRNELTIAYFTRLHRYLLVPRLVFLLDNS